MPAVIYAPGPSLDRIEYPVDGGPSIAVTGAIRHPVVRACARYWLVSDPGALDVAEGPVDQMILYPSTWRDDEFPQNCTTWPEQRRCTLLDSRGTPFVVEEMIRSLGDGAPGKWRRWSIGKAVAWLALRGHREIVTAGVDWSGGGYHAEDPRPATWSEKRWSMERAEIEALCGFAGVTLSGHQK